MEKTIDARGLSCPQPVLETKRALEGIAEGIISVIVDNTTARENVRKFAEGSGCSVAVEEKEGNHFLTLKKGNVPKDKKVPETAPGDTVMIISTDVLGKGDRALGETLMDAFIHTLLDADPMPGKLIFLNEGIKLVAEGSHLIEALEMFEKKGVQISACGTCLNFYKLKDKLRVGEVTNMYEVVTSLSKASKVISI